MFAQRISVIFLLIGQMEVCDDIFVSGKLFVLFKIMFYIKREQTAVTTLLTRMPSSADVRFYDDRVLIKLGITTTKNSSMQFTSLCLAKFTNHIYLYIDLFHSEFMTKLSFSLPLFGSKKIILIFSFDIKKSFFF